MLSLAKAWVLMFRTCVCHAQQENIPSLVLLAALLVQQENTLPTRLPHAQIAPLESIQIKVQHRAQTVTQESTSIPLVALHWEHARDVVRGCTPTQVHTSVTGAPRGRGLPRRAAVTRASHVLLVNTPMGTQPTHAKCALVDSTKTKEVRMAVLHVAEGSTDLVHMRFAKIVLRANTMPGRIKTDVTIVLLEERDHGPGKQAVGTARLEEGHLQVHLLAPVAPLDNKLQTQQVHVWAVALDASGGPGHGVTTATLASIQMAVQIMLATTATTVHTRGGDGIGVMDVHRVITHGGDGVAATPVELERKSITGSMAAIGVPLVVGNVTPEDTTVTLHHGATIQTVFTRMLHALLESIRISTDKHIAKHALGDSTMLGVAGRTAMAAQVGSEVRETDVTATVQAKFGFMAVPGGIMPDSPTNMAGGVRLTELLMEITTQTGVMAHVPTPAVMVRGGVNHGGDWISDPPTQCRLSASGIAQTAAERGCTTCRSGQVNGG